jgi:NADPH-dependent ferric siderophore reductase
MSAQPPPSGGTAQPDARPRKPRFQAQVTRVEPLTPRMVRVTFGGPALADFAWNGPASHIKLIFADAPQDAPAVDGSPPRPTMRTYTPRRFDPRAAELDVDFVIHGEGPASTWAAQAQVGQPLTIAGPGRSYAIDREAGWYVLAGDETAIPALGTILEALPAHVPATVLIEVADEAEAHPIASREKQTDVRWLVRGEDPTHAGEALERALRALAWPTGSGRVYVACEAGAMRRIRRHLLNERGVPRELLVTRGYWRIGATDHPDRDYGEDVG